MSGHNRKNGVFSGISAKLLLAGAALSVALPSASMALNGIDGVGTSLRGGFGSFTPASIDPALAKLMSSHGTKGLLMRFTPAGAANRSVTVAVRVDEKTARAIQVRAALPAAQSKPGAAPVAITPARYDLGLALGYRSFTPAPELKKIEMPDLSTFKPGKKDSGEASRFNARIAVADGSNAGRAPRTAEAIGEQRLDVGGSYRVTRNLDVTAGVRYSQERDRLTPLTDGTQDSQAVYVGTQFRF